MTTPEQHPVTQLASGEPFDQNKNMLPMSNSKGTKYAMKYEPGHPYHGWIFYDNHGTWVTWRMGFAHEIQRAKMIVALRDADIPQKG